MFVGRVVFVVGVAVALVLVGCDALALQRVRSDGRFVVFVLLLFVLSIGEFIVVVLIVIRSSSVIVVDFSAGVGEFIILIVLVLVLVRLLLENLLDEFLVDRRRSITGRSGGRTLIAQPVLEMSRFALLANLEQNTESKQQLRRR